MRATLRYLLLLACFLPFGLAAQTIYAPASVDRETLDDVAQLLQQATGKNWQHKAYEKPSAPGIYLQTGIQKGFTTKESFRLQSNGKDQLVITSSSPEGLVFGLYRHLRRLGFSFYLPDDLYAVIPRLAHPYGAQQDLVDKPFLQVRNFFGTGGFGTTTPDPEKKVEKAWIRWKLRNGFGNAYHLGGHRGENFILENYELLRRNPQWLAQPLTGDKHKDQSIKLNYFNREALAFYIDWTLKPLTSNFIKPPSFYTEFISIEPSDGGGFLEKQGHQTISISDQVYGAANKAAEKLDRLFPDNPNIGVNLYAYSGHAAPPSFRLHPRVYVQLVPYQFQNIAFGPSFIKLWAAKASRFGIYDYLNYTDAQYDLPGGLTLDEVMKRLIHSVRNGSEGTHFETSFSKFATGIPLWVIGRYMADGSAQWEQNFEKLVKDLYGQAASKILPLYHLFYRESGFGAPHLGNAAKLVEEAAALAPAQDQQQRLHELKLYLHYMHLVYRSKDPSKGSLHERMVPLAEFAWKTFQQKIVHSYRIMQLVSYDFLNSKTSDPNHAYYQQLHEQWFPEGDRTKSAWNRIPQTISRTEVEKNFKAILNSYKPSERPAQFNMLSLRELMLSSGLQPNRTLVFGGGPAVRAYFGIYAEKATTLHLRYRISGAHPGLRISAVDNNYLADTALLINSSTGSLRIKIPAGETTILLNAAEGSDYRIEATLENGLYFFDSAPRGKMAFYKNFSDPYEKYTYEASYYPSHFYMPRVSSVDYRVQLNSLALTSPKQRTPASQILSTEHGGFENRRFSVQPDEAGKIWKAEISGNYNYNFLNIPDRYFLLQKK